MSRKRRFEFSDAKFEEEANASDSPSSVRSRLGPMAAAVRDSGAARRAEDAGHRLSEIQTLELAAEAKRLRDADLDLRMVEIEAIRTDYLTRDRTEVSAEALEELKQSIRANGLQLPIRVDELDDGGLGLVQGLRRLMAFRGLYEELGDEQFARIPAMVDRPRKREAAYRTMVDENLIRENVSFAELAALATSYAEEAGVSALEAIDALFASADRNKRWSIGVFVRILASLGDVLQHPSAISRNLGRAVGKRLEAEGGSEFFRKALAEGGSRSAEEEVSLLDKLARAGTDPRPAARPREPKLRRLRVALQDDGRVDYQVSISASRLVIQGPGLMGLSDDEVREAVVHLLAKRMLPRQQV
ncbi:MAG: ParB N-terminal domain-containing protein [Erythrobacter sp.]|jgi:ParB family chromosome partitioning protein|nr:ParB N-terminal domain-containing protein [Erythrobacter sp.]